VLKKKAQGAQFAAKTVQILYCEGAASPGGKDQGSAHQPLHTYLFFHLNYIFIVAFDILKLFFPRSA
jgi:hypothetical protein